MPEENEVLIRKIENLERLLNRHLGPATIASQLNTPHPANAFTPSGIIVMWSGAVADIPSGWVLCDGTNNSPDLRNKFVIGAGDTYSPDDTGGAATVTLTATELPAHTHGAGSYAAANHSHSSGSYSAASNGAHTHTVTYADLLVSGNSFPEQNYQNNPVTANTSSDGAHTHSITGSSGSTAPAVSGTSSSTGSGTGFSILPPYYALAFIMKT